MYTISEQSISESNNDLLEKEIQLNKMMFLTEKGFPLEYLKIIKAESLDEFKNKCFELSELMNIEVEKEISKKLGF